MSAESTPESALSYYFAHRPTDRQPTIQMWTPILRQLLADGVSAKAAHVWICEHKDKLSMPIPAASTLRDWMTKIRNSKENQPLHRSRVARSAPSQRDEKPIPEPPSMDAEEEKKPVTESKRDELRRLDREISDLAVDADYPDQLIKLKIRELTLIRGEEPTPEQVRDFYPGIRRDMRSKGLRWEPPN